MQASPAAKARDVSELQWTLSPLFPGRSCDIRVGTMGRVLPQVARGEGRLKPVNRLKSVAILLLLVLFALTSQGCIGVLVVSGASMAGAAAVAAAAAAGAMVAVPP
jgi:hypothetical protein